MKLIHSVIVKELLKIQVLITNKLQIEKKKLQKTIKSVCFVSIIA